METGIARLRPSEHITPNPITIQTATYLVIRAQPVELPYPAGKIGRRLPGMLLSFDRENRGIVTLHSCFVSSTRNTCSQL
jgi:hypothetical protein